MIVDLFSYLMLACFFTHELDAIDKHEWRIFPILENLSDAIARTIFIWLHVPIFFGIMIFTQNNITGYVAQCISAFMIIHIGLHWLFLKKVKNEFVGFSSWAYIVFSGVFGALHITALYI